jgi:hypothetical protein
VSDEDHPQMRLLRLRSDDLHRVSEHDAELVEAQARRVVVKPDLVTGTIDPGHNRREIARRPVDPVNQK